MRQGYHIHDQKGFYFLTFQVIHWIDIFSRKIYSDIIIDSFEYCRLNKELRLWAYVIMTNHVHVIMSADNGDLSNIVRDFKRHTSSKILKQIRSNKESRRKWMLQQFERAAKRHKRNKNNLQFWTHENHAVELFSYKFTMQKLAYIHLNPVRAGYVEKAEDWLYSSQRNYLKMEAVVEIDLFDI